MPPLQELKKEIPIPSSYHPHPALPLPRHKDGGIFDKGEGVKNGISYTMYLRMSLFTEGVLRRATLIK